MFINILIDSDCDIFYICHNHCSIVPQITVVINIVIVTLVDLYELIKIRINYAIVNNRDCMIYICN